VTPTLNLTATNTTLLFTAEF
jgi:hypothetical protein